MGIMCEPFKMGVTAVLTAFAPEELATAAIAAKAAKGIEHVLQAFGVKIPQQQLIDKIIEDAGNVSKLAEDIGKLAGIC